MPAQLSVVMPTLNSEAGLARSLPALAEGLTTGLIHELVISDGGSKDATLEIAAAAGAVLVEGPPSRGGQLLRGAQVAKGSWLLFVHSDTVLSLGWSDTILTHLPSAHPGWFPMRFDDAGMVASFVAGWANLRARVFHLPYGDQGLLISRADYDRVGGFRDIPLMEDVAMSCALGRSLRPLPCYVTTSAEKYRKDGWVRRGAHNLFLLTRFLLGADPRGLVRKYR